MYRIIALFLCLLVVLAPASPAFSQYRTKVNQQELGPAPSFRGGERQSLPDQIPIQQGSSGYIPLPSAQGGASGAMGMDSGSSLINLGYQVHVLGEVMNPGTYRVTASDRVSEVIKKAGGLALNGSDRWIELRRRGGGVQVVDLLAFKLLGKLDQNPYVTDNDAIFVPLRKSVIQVVGAVKRPDYYELRNEKNLSDVISLAGGFSTAAAKGMPIKIIRFSNGEKTVTDVVDEEQNIKEFAVNSGDVIFVPDLLTKDTKFDYNVASIPGDQVFYPSYEDRVFVLGGVAFPGAYAFSPYYTVSQYVTLAGGLNDRGKEKYKVIHIDGKSKHTKGNHRVNPGDTIMVKQSWMSPAAWMGFALGIASFGLSASATVIAISK
ncbi:MAG: SLBB domain-containing protein [bacterium]